MKKNKVKKNITRYWQLYTFLLIPLIYVVVFKYIPMGGLVMAFEKFSPRLGIFKSEWVGFANFKKFFNSYQFWRILKNTLILSIYNLLAKFPIPIVFALMMNCIRRERLKKGIQTIVVLPHFISTTVIVGILLQLFNNQTGLYGYIGQWLTGENPANILGSTAAFRHLYVWSGIWKDFGWGSIIYTAALAGVDPTYHEAAMLDGATRFQRILHVDLPSITPTIIIMLILDAGKVMSLGFEKVYLMQNSLNLPVSQVISTYVYDVGLVNANASSFSYATAIGIFNSVINLILIYTVNKISRRVSETSLW